MERESKSRGTLRSMSKVPKELIASMAVMKKLTDELPKQLAEYERAATYLLFSDHLCCFRAILFRVSKFYVNPATNVPFFIKST
ncbi:hypothetical protein CRG98_043627 [Punica granatum]|uniref:Uncharacterized protein n=1 Tax=Punica granatum TaxID=22663 RepID=A0A2I0HWA9_PUNGR|nr:hypothetical protein CRG98_043627 [Punica granatum]